MNIERKLHLCSSLCFILSWQLVECPLILSPDLLLLFGREVILDVEGLPNLLRCLPLDHRCHCLACEIEENLDVEVVSGLRGERWGGVRRR